MSQFVRDDTPHGHTDGSAKARFLASNLEGMPFSRSWDDDFSAYHRNGWLQVEDEAPVRAVRTGDTIYLRHGYFMPSAEALPWSLLRPTDVAWGVHKISPKGEDKGVFEHPDASAVAYTGQGGYLILRWSLKSDRFGARYPDSAEDVNGSWRIPRFGHPTGDAYIADITRKTEDSPWHLLSWCGDGDERLIPVYSRMIYKRKYEWRRLDPYLPEAEQEKYPYVVTEERSFYERLPLDSQLSYPTQLLDYMGGFYYGRTHKHYLYRTLDHLVTYTHLHPPPMTYVRPLLVDGAATYPYPILITTVPDTSTLTHTVVARSIDPQTKAVTREVTLLRNRTLSATPIAAQRIGPTTLVALLAFTAPFFRTAYVDDGARDSMYVPAQTQQMFLLSTDNGATWHEVRGDLLKAVNTTPGPALHTSRSGSTIDRFVAYERVSYMQMGHTHCRILPLQPGKALIALSRLYVTTDRPGAYAGHIVSVRDVAVGVLDVGAREARLQHVLCTDPDTAPGRKGALLHFGHAQDMEPDGPDIYLGGTDDVTIRHTGSAYWLWGRIAFVDAAVSRTGAVVLVMPNYSPESLPGTNDRMQMHYYDTQGVRQQSLEFPARAATYRISSLVGQHDGSFSFTAGLEDVALDSTRPQEKLTGTYAMRWAPGRGFWTTRRLSSDVETATTMNRLDTVDWPPYVELMSGESKLDIQVKGKKLPISPAPAWAYA